LERENGKKRCQKKGGSGHTGKSPHIDASKVPKGEKVEAGVMGGFKRKKKGGGGIGLKIRR